MKKYLLPILLIALLLIAINSRTNAQIKCSTPDSVINFLTGKWTWVESQGGFTGSDLITPQSIGYTKSYQFAPVENVKDSIFYSYYKNEALQESKKTELSYAQSIFGKDQWILKDIAGLSSGSVAMTFQSADSVILADNYPDGYTHLLVRDKTSELKWNSSKDFVYECETNLRNAQYAGNPILRQNDSIIILDIFEHQCCPVFALKISDIHNDSIYVSFKDTAQNMCDCICTMRVRLSITPYTTDNLKVNYNGTWYKLNESDVVPIGAEGYYIEAYPNPTDGWIVVKTNNEDYINANVTDPTGRLILSTSFTGTTRLDMTDLQSGIYLIKFKQGNKLIGIKKIIKR